MNSGKITAADAESFDYHPWKGI